MARAPVAGQAKTRLVPALGAAGAAALAERLLAHAVAQALAADIGPVLVWATPDASHPAFVRAGQQAGVSLQLQGEGDLGARMARVFEHGFAATQAPWLLMGSDAPALGAALLRDAATALQTSAAVFVPAFDGGYALVGLQPCGPQRLATLFADMAWSTPQVMAQTRARMAAAGLRHAELPPVADIDEPADLVHLPPGWAASA